VDFVLATSRARMRTAFASLTGRKASGDAELLDTLSDLLGLVLKGVLHHLEEHRVVFVRPLPSRAFVGAPRLPGSEHSLKLERSDCQLSVLESTSARKTTPFSALAPGQVLLGALHPPALPQVEVLARGTLLKPSYLQRARSFFQAAGETPVEVMAASPFTQAQSA
jgi:hypothetical protein